MGDSTMLTDIIMGMFAGILAGTIPLIYGASKQKLQLGFLAFFVCAISGMVLGLLLAIPFAAYFVYTISKESS